MTRRAGPGASYRFTSARGGRGRGHHENQMPLKDVGF